MAHVKFTEDELKTILRSLYDSSELITPLSDEEVAEIEALPVPPIEPSRLQRMWREFEDMRREWFGKAG